jgi:hypothetical protein
MNRRKMLRLLEISPALLAGANVDTRTLNGNGAHGAGHSSHRRVIARRSARREDAGSPLNTRD